MVPYYSELAEKGCSQGFLVFGHDLVGHGFSQGLYKIESPLAINIVGNNKEIS